MQGFVYFSEQTHQSQSQWVGNGIESGDNVYTGVQANHKERDAGEAPPLLLTRARAITSNPLAKDRSTMAKCFTKFNNNQPIPQNQKYHFKKKDPRTYTYLAGDRWIVAKCFTNTQYSNFCRSTQAHSDAMQPVSHYSLRIASTVSMQLRIWCHSG